MASWYSDEQVDEAVRWVTATVPNTDLGTVGYEETLRALGLPSVAVIGVGQLSSFMGDFHRAQGEIPYDSVVVNQQTGLPGHGYWTINDRRDPMKDGSSADIRFWKDQQNEVWGAGGHDRRHEGED